MSLTQFNTQLGAQRTAKAPGIHNLPSKKQAKTAAPATGTPATNAASLNILNGITAAHKTARATQLQNAVNNGIDTQRDYAAEILPGIGQPRTVDNVNRVKALANSRAMKTQLPQYAQYDNDDVQQAAKIYTSTPGYRDDVDYAAQIQQLSQLPPTAENQQLMRDALAARNAKIAAGGEAMAQYANDGVQQQAQQYLKYYAPGTADMTSYYDRADELAAQNYAEQEKYLQAQEDAQLAAVRENYDASRRATDLAYARQSRASENLLAEQGIGRGLGAAPSSGYSESARAGALADYSNGINQTYSDQDAAERDIAAQIAAARLQASIERNDALMQNQYARAQQANADREHAFTAHQFNTGLDQYNEGMDYQRGRDAVGDEQWQMGFDRGVFESDRNFDWQKSVDERNFDWQKSVDERNFNWQKSVDERNFDADQFWNEKDYGLAYYNAYKKSAPKTSYVPSDNSQPNVEALRAALEDEEEQTKLPTPTNNFFYAGEQGVKSYGPK